MCGFRVALYGDAELQPRRETPGSRSLISVRKNMVDHRGARNARARNEFFYSLNARAELAVGQRMK
jgi:hypothetical protein